MIIWHPKSNYLNQTALEIQKTATLNFSFMTGVAPHVFLLVKEQRVTVQRGRD